MLLPPMNNTSVFASQDRAWVEVRLGRIAQGENHGRRDIGVALETRRGSSI